MTGNAERQGKSEDDPRLRMEPLGRAEGERGTAEHALEGAHQVVMADETEVAVLAETESAFIECHAACRAPPPSNV
jgi:hypothetical protein